MLMTVFEAIYLMIAFATFIVALLSLVVAIIIAIINRK